MSRHNYNYFVDQEFGHVDPRFDQGYGRFMANARPEGKRSQRDTEARRRVEKRAKDKKMQRDLRYLGE
jgi:hypothetical protein